MEQNLKRRNKSGSWKYNRKKKETPQRNRWLVEECKIIKEDKNGAYNKMINRK